MFCVSFAEVLVYEVQGLIGCGGFLSCAIQAVVFVIDEWIFSDDSVSRRITRVHVCWRFVEEFVI